MERYNVVVIGAGSGGLVVAGGAAGLGARAALVEKHKMGGDCLNYGCVPSKALLASAKLAARARRATELALDGVVVPAAFDLATVMARVHGVQATIAPHDSVERFTGLGVDVRLGTGRIVDRNTVEVGSERLWGKHIVLATGSRPNVPDLPGLTETGYLTNETVFAATTLPSRLVVLGTGPIGCELGQAFARLGSRVTLVSHGNQILPKDEPEAAVIVQRALEADGARVLLGRTCLRAERGEHGKTLVLRAAGEEEERIDCDEILIAVGRRPNVEGLGLENVGVHTSRTGIVVDRWLRTSVPNIWAVGDVTGPFLFTHTANHQARAVLRNALFPGKKAVDYSAVPWCTFTDPEVAHVGLTSADARARGIPFEPVRVGFDRVDRALCDGDTAGFASVLAGPKGQILGATVVHPHAGDLVHELVLAMQAKLPLSRLSSTIHIYPTTAEFARALGDAYQRTKLKPGIKNAFERFFAWQRGR